jgi:uncharacterized protein (DUF302 family)/glutaredoxin
MKLYQREDCPSSLRVRRRLAALGATYTIVNVEPEGVERPGLHAVSGQSETPVLVCDDGRVIVGAAAILAHLEEGVAASATSARPAAPPANKGFAERPAYGMTRQLPAMRFDVAREELQRHLTKEGFLVLSVIDLGETLRAKAKVNLGRPYLLLAVCHARLASEALAAEPYVGLLLPGRILITEADNGDALVSVARPLATLEPAASATVSSVADREEALLLKVLTSL